MDFEESKIKKVHFQSNNNNENNQIEEEKNFEISRNSKFRNNSEKKKRNNLTLNRTNRTEENSFFNFLENNSFVKMNKKNLQNPNAQKDLIVPVTNKQNVIKKDLIFNENQLILNYQKINELDEGKKIIILL